MSGECNCALLANVMQCRVATNKIICVACSYASISSSTIALFSRKLNRLWINDALCYGCICIYLILSTDALANDFANDLLCLVCRKSSSICGNCRFCCYIRCLFAAKRKEWNDGWQFAVVPLHISKHFDERRCNLKTGVSYSEILATEMKTWGKKADDRCVLLKTDLDAPAICLWAELHRIELGACGCCLHYFITLHDYLFRQHPRLACTF